MLENETIPNEALELAIRLLFLTEEGRASVTSFVDSLEKIHKYQLEPAHLPAEP